MSRPPWGVYVLGNEVVRAGRRDREPRGAETFHAVTEPAARALLDSDDLDRLKWDGTNVVARSQSELEALDRGKAIVQDDVRFESEREKAILLVLLDEINVLRNAAGLAPRTIQQAKNAYKAKLNR